LRTPRPTEGCRDDDDDDDDDDDEDDDDDDDECGANVGWSMRWMPHCLHHELKHPVFPDLLFGYTKLQTEQLWWRGNISGFVSKGINNTPRFSSRSYPSLVHTTMPQTYSMHNGYYRSEEEDEEEEEGEEEGGGGGGRRRSPCKGTSSYTPCAMGYVTPEETGVSNSPRSN